ncbi:hypothetical protein VP1G_05882 [Cytospora mali]|uniref:Uncharacterized protein n=1 Tax=Cytospora mali TaxID=578113 RepID=A0A194V3T3_CYTMA|nr:hypothetical protein VP1G_05882 [Valsa mali var. pyri (nom. inval.)]
MHSYIAISMLISLTVSQSLILEAPDGTCGYLNGERLASYGCHATTQKCAVYYPTSTLAVDTITDISVALTGSATPSFRTLTPRAAKINTVVITPAPQVDYPAVVCCDPSAGDCTAQPTTCVDAFEHPYSTLCAGSRLNDPMTLKCTAGHALHCNQIQFQSPLYYQRNEDSGDGDAPRVGMGVARGPAPGWFCGASALPTRFIESTIISSRPVFADESLLPEASAMFAGSPSDYSHVNEPNLPQAISPFTTVPFTITLGEQIGTPSPRPGPNPGTVDDGVIPLGSHIHDSDAGSEDCCVDEPAFEECCTDDPVRRRRRLQRRRDPEAHRIGTTVLTFTVTSPNQIGLATTTDTPAAAPAMAITEVFAVVSTTYVGQSDRPPFTEATRSWKIFAPTPTLNVTTTSLNDIGPHGREGSTKEIEGQQGHIHVRRIIAGAIGGLLGLVLLAVLIRWCDKRRKLGENREEKRQSDKDEDEDEDEDNKNDRPPARRSVRAMNYLQDKYAGLKDCLSWTEDQSGESTPPTLPPRNPGPDSDPDRYTASPRGGIHPYGSMPHVYNVSSMYNNFADCQRGCTDGPCPCRSHVLTTNWLAQVQDDGDPPN